MTMETLIKSACEDWAAEAQVPAGLADRALRRRTRQRSLKVALAAGSTALVLGAAAVLVSTTAGPGPRTSRPTIQPVPMSTETSVRADPSSSFPRQLVAAGHVAVAAYYTGRQRSVGQGQKAYQRTWYLYNPGTGRYAKTAWGFLDVAPGLHQAAVLEGPLPASRVGILDMKTQQVTRWIEVDHPVGAVAWAPDGRRLVLTTYSANPDVMDVPSTRTGFYVTDAELAPSAFHALPPDSDNMNYRQDLGWSRSGTLLWAPRVSDPARYFFDLNGNRQPAPAYEAIWWDEAGLSPNGTLLPKFGPAPGPAVTVTNVKTQKKVAVLPIEQARAWADDTQLFAIGCDPKACTGKGEFRNRLLLVSLDGKITPLTGYRRSDQPGTWTPVFTHR